VSLPLFEPSSGRPLLAGSLHRYFLLVPFAAAASPFAPAR